MNAITSVFAVSRIHVDAPQRDQDIMEVVEHLDGRIRILIAPS